MAYKDMRDWLTAVECDGELKRLSGANWNLEMSSITEIVYREGKQPIPALLFDNILDYPGGIRGRRYRFSNIVAVVRLILRYH